MPKKATAAASQKARRSTKQPAASSGPLLTVTLDPEASKHVRDFAEALAEDPRDVTCGLITLFLPGAQRSWDEEQRCTRLGNRSFEEEWQYTDEAVNEARRRRVRRERAGDVMVREHRLSMTLVGLQEIVHREERVEVLEAWAVLMKHVQSRLRDA